MKMKSSKKTALRENALAAMPNSTNTNSEEMPSGLEFFDKLKDKTESEQLAVLAPDFATLLESGNTDKLAQIAGFFSGFGIDLGAQVPEWAKTASKKFWEAHGGELENFSTQLQAGQAAACGKFVGLVEFSSTNNPLSEAEQATQALAQLIKKEAIDLPANETLKYSTGRVNAGKIKERANGLSQRTKVFGFI